MRDYFQQMRVLTWRRLPPRMPAKQVRSHCRPDRIAPPHGGKFGDSLVIQVARRLGSLDRSPGVAGIPEYPRSRNSPKFVAQDSRNWSRGSGIRSVYIEPGTPWENVY